jgi:peptidyl-prolyl cis-trans isomerase C
MRCWVNVVSLSVAMSALCVGGCKKKAADGSGAAASASSAPGKLTPELAAKVVARIGDKEITLADYAATLERMDQFERLRYQSPERRKALLDEIIQVELLAAEAKRRGLDQRPETRERIRQILRDELLQSTREDLPPPASIPESEVRAYYDAHRDDFREPERRRVAVIALSSEARAKQVLAEAKKATPAAWGRLVQQYSLDKLPKASPLAPLELAGDLGIVGPPGNARGDNPRIPGPVRKALFEIPQIGGVYPGVVADQGKYYVLRMTGKTDARDRTQAEADRSIRVSILQQKIQDREKQLEAELRKKYPVRVDQAALAQVEIPEPKIVEPSGMPGETAPIHAIPPTGFGPITGGH